MSAPVDVLAVLDREIEEARKRVPFMPPGGTESTEHQQAYDESGSVLVNLRETRAAVAELIEATTALRARLCLHGDWEDRCFYYNGYSAPELMAPMAGVDAALARVKGGAA